MGICIGDHHKSWYAIVDDVVELYKTTDMSISQLAKRFKTTTTTVRNMIDFYHVPIKPRRRLYRVDQSFFADVDNESKAYWLGFLGADGSVSNPDVIRLNIAEKDEEHLETFRTALDSNYPIRRLDREYPSVSLGIHSKQMVKDLAKYGIIPNKSLTYGWPEALDPTLYQHFIRGYIDGDGCFHELSVTVIATTSFAQRLQDILMRECQLNQTKIIAVSSGNMASFSYHGVYQLQRIITYLYKDATTWLKRKRNIAEEAVSHRLQEIEEMNDKKDRIKTSIKTLYEQGRYPAQIIRELNLPPTTVRRYLRKMNLL